MAERKHPSHLPHPSAPSPDPSNLKPKGLSLAPSKGKLLQHPCNQHRPVIVSPNGQLREVSRQVRRAVAMDILGEELDVLVGRFIGFLFFSQVLL